VTTGRAVVVLTTWIDDGGLRVRMTAADDLAGPSRPVGVAADVDAACDMVRTWLEGVAAAAGARSGRPPTTG
jgi:hypothetical protein